MEKLGLVLLQKSAEMPEKACPIDKLKPKSSDFPNPRKKAAERNTRRRVYSCLFQKNENAGNRLFKNFFRFYWAFCAGKAPLDFLSYLW